MHLERLIEDYSVRLPARIGCIRLLTLVPFLQADKKTGLPPPSNLEMNREGVEVDKESKKKTTKLHSLVIRHVMTDSLPNVARGSATLVIHPKEPVLKVMCVSLFHSSPPRLR